MLSFDERNTFPFEDINWNDTTSTLGFNHPFTPAASPLESLSAPSCNVVTTKLEDLWLSIFDDQSHLQHESFLSIDNEFHPHNPCVEPNQPFVEQQLQQQQPQPQISLQYEQFQLPVHQENLVHTVTASCSRDDETETVSNQSDEDPLLGTLVPIAEVVMSCPSEQQPSYPNEPQLTVFPSIYVQSLNNGVDLQIRGARKLVLHSIDKLDEINSLPYKYVFKLIIPAALGPISHEGIKFVLVSFDSSVTQCVENGIEVEKHCKTKIFPDHRELDFKVFMRAYSHGHNKAVFSVEVYNNEHDILFKSQAKPIFARRNRNSKRNQCEKKRKRGSPSPTKSRKQKCADEDDE